jgi:hypothetical protein
MRGVAAALFCLLLMTGGSFAQQYPQARGYVAPLNSYRPAATIVGTYNSDNFHPTPLVLTISGMDASGNLSGYMWGMRTLPSTTNEDPSWERWQRVFGRDGMRATYRDGRVLIQFPNGAYYDLQLSGNMLSGKYVASDDDRRMTFIKSTGVAAR